MLYIHALEGGMVRIFGTICADCDNQPDIYNMNGLSTSIGAGWPVIRRRGHQQNITVFNNKVDGPQIH